MLSEEKIRQLLKELNGSGESISISRLKRLRSALEGVRSIGKTTRTEAIRTLQVIIVECTESFASSAEAVFCLGTDALWGEDVRAWLKQRSYREVSTERLKISEAITKVMKAHPKFPK